MEDKSPVRQLKILQCVPSLLFCSLPVFLEKDFLPGFPSPSSLAGCRMPWEGVSHYLYKIILERSNLGKKLLTFNEIGNYLATVTFDDPFTLITPRNAVAGKSHETC